VDDEIPSVYTAAAAAEALGFYTLYGPGDSKERFMMSATAYFARLIESTSIPSFLLTYRRARFANGDLGWLAIGEPVGS
jgi:hypothetical protein